MQVVELDDRLAGAAIAKPVTLKPTTSWLDRGLDRVLSRDRQAKQFVLEAGQAPAAILQGRPSFALFEFDPDGRPVLQVLPGMTGDLRIGVSRMTVAQMLADPSLRLPDGGARLPLPYGARLRIQCGPRTFVARIGGAPLEPIPDPAAASHTQLATA